MPETLNIAVDPVSIGLQVGEKVISAILAAYNVERSTMSQENRDRMDAIKVEASYLWLRLFRKFVDAVAPEPAGATGFITAPPVN